MCLPGVRVEFDITDGPKGPQAATFVWSESLELPFGLVGRLGWPVAKPVFALGVRQALRRFARFAENYSIGAL